MSLNEPTPLTPKQETLMLAMLSSSGIVEAARVASVPLATAKRWVKLPHFKQSLDDAQSEIFEASLTTLKLATHDAVATLARVCKDTDAPHSAQVRAAQLLLEKSIEMHKMSDMERKIAELEQVIGKTSDTLSVDDGSITIDTRDLTSEQLKKLKAFALEMKELRGTS